MLGAIFLPVNRAVFYEAPASGLWERVASGLAAVDSDGLSRNDARALAVMRRSLARDLNPISRPAGAADANGGMMEFRENIVRAGFCGVLFTLPACGGEQKEGNQSSADTSDTVPRLESAEVVRARANIAGPPGSGIKGKVTFVELNGNFPEPGVDIEARIAGPPGELSPGPHGLHIHENAKGGCLPPYTSAGGHFDPGPAGNPDPDVNHPFHMGDIPNVAVDQLGVGVMEARTSRITLSPGPLSVLDDNGSVVIVHENADRGIPGPAKSGVSGGPRIACGVIQLDSAR